MAATAASGQGFTLSDEAEPTPVSVEDDVNEEPVVRLWPVAEIVAGGGSPKVLRAATHAAAEVRGALGRFGRQFGSAPAPVSAVVVDDATSEEPKSQAAATARSCSAIADRLVRDAAGHNLMSAWSSRIVQEACRQLPPSWRQLQSNMSQTEGF